MKKILILGLVLFFSFVIFAQSEDADTDTNSASAAFAYMDANGIEYIFYDESEVAELPKGATLLTVEAIESFIGGMTLTDSILMESYAYANASNPSGRRLGLAGGVDATDYTGYRFKFEKYNEIYMAWGNFTKDRFCPGGSTNTLVDYCTETDPTNNTIQYGDYSEYTACGQCDDDEIVRFRYGVNAYTTSYVRTWNGFIWVYLPVTLYAGWQYAVMDGTPQPYSPSSDLCSTPVMLTYLCPYI